MRLRRRFLYCRARLVASGNTNNAIGAIEAVRCQLGIANGTPEFRPGRSTLGRMAWSCGLVRTARDSSPPTHSPSIIIVPMVLTDGASLKQDRKADLDAPGHMRCFHLPGSDRLRAREITPTVLGALRGGRAGFWVGIGTLRPGSFFLDPMANALKQSPGSRSLPSCCCCSSSAASRRTPGPDRTARDTQAPAGRIMQ